MSNDSLDNVLDRLLLDYKGADRAMQHVNSYELPSKADIENVVEQFRAIMFPGVVGHSLARTTHVELRERVRERLQGFQSGLRKQLYRGLHHDKQSRISGNDLDCPHCLEQANVIAEQLMGRLIELRQKLAKDVRAHVESDPAALGAHEIVFCYPGIYAIAVHRLANELLGLGAKIIPRIMTEIAHEKTGVDIHPGASIGESFFIDHGTGTVIGETAVIGNRVKIYQGVTLGALSVGFDSAGKRRHPTLEDDVVIYSGATILGGDTVIGKGAVIGGNCWVTESVPAGTMVTLESPRKNTAL